MLQIELDEILRETYGRSPWSGADSRVWRVGDFVLKSMRVTPERWQNMRTLQRRMGPFAPILDMRVVGRERDNWGDGWLIVGLIVQPFVRMDHAPALDRWTGDMPHDRNINDVPRFWHDGIDGWWQSDVGEPNAVAGKWVDLARIIPIFSSRTGGREELAEDLIERVKDIQLSIAA